MFRSIFKRLIKPSPLNLVPSLPPTTSISPLLAYPFSSENTALKAPLPKPKKNYTKNEARPPREAKELSSEEIEILIKQTAEPEG
jgi:hypothetical protein